MVDKYKPKDLAKLIEKDDLDQLSYALKGLDPDEARLELMNSLGQHVFENYDTGIEKAIKEADRLEARPLLQRATSNIYQEAPEINLSKLYEEPIKKPIKLKVFQEKGGDLGHMFTNQPNEPVAYLNRSYSLKDVDPRGVVLHEADHLTDLVNKNYIPPKEEEILKKIGKGAKGLEGAIEKYGTHHKRGLFELEALKKLTKNKLLGAIPVLGTALTAHEIFDSGNVFAADPTGITSSENLGEGSDTLPKEEQIQKQKYNDRMKKMKQILGEE